MAQYFHDFNLDSTGAGLPTGIVRFTSMEGNGTFSVVELGEENVLQREDSVGDHLPDPITISGVGSVSGTTEVYARIQFASTGSYRGGPVLFADPEEEASGYLTSFFAGTDIRHYDLAEGFTHLGTQAFSWSADIWYNIITRIVSGTMSTWVWEDGGTPLVPGVDSPTFTVSSLSVHTEGEVGVAPVRSFGNFYLAQMGIGTNGDRAPMSAGGSSGPTITSHPSSDEVTEPTPGEFSVSATGEGSLSYQWQVNDGEGWVNVSTGSGGTTDTYTTGATSVAMDGYQYRCAVTDDDGTTNSNAATLTVNASEAAPVLRVKAIGDTPSNAIRDIDSGDAIPNGTYTVLTVPVGSADDGTIRRHQVTVTSGVLADMTNEAYETEEDEFHIVGFLNSDESVKFHAVGEVVDSGED